MALVATFYYNEVSLSLVLTTCQKLVSSNLARETVMEMADVLKDVAKNCMTRNKFNYPGILCLAKLLWLLAPPFHQSRGGLYCNDWSARTTNVCWAGSGLTSWWSWSGLWQSWEGRS